MTPEDTVVLRTLEVGEFIGRDRAVTGAVLVQLTGLKNRVLRRCVHNLITREGVMIGSRSTQPEGYFLIRDLADVKMSIKGYYRTGRECFEKGDALWLSAKERFNLTGQLILPLRVGQGLGESALS